MGASIKKLRLIQLIAVIFLTISGGAYGLEPLLTYAGANGAMLLLFITPLLWDIPTIFTVLELNSMMPVTGGYYQWVKRALGMRFAFYEGWWTWLYTFVDLAIYPVLFIEYGSYFFPEIETYKIPICLIIIWGSAIINIFGIITVGKISVVFSILVITPFILLFGIGIYKHTGSYLLPAPSFKGLDTYSLGMALFTVMWNFIGWDNTTTYAEEVEKPVKTYLKSISIAFLIIFVVYFLSVYTAIISGYDLKLLEEEEFPGLGVFLGGKWLGSLLALGGMASGLGLYSAVLLSVSRVPQVMADDKLVPVVLNKLHSKHKTPYISILFCSVVVSLMTIWTFEELLIIDITLYGAALFLEFIALIVLRIKAPDEHRPFKIPFNVAGLCLMTLLPLGVYLLALGAAFSDAGKGLIPVVFALGILLTAEILWTFIRLRRKA
ncbi:MAG: APC family permease [Pyrinomonadaceae bacterium]|nr:APC family permease [Sphingobacteriaceae bacterium]